MRRVVLDDVEVRYLSGAGEAVLTSLARVDVVGVSEGLPVRRPSSRRGQLHYAGLFWSGTNRGHVPYESLLELDRLWLADFDVDVARMAAQPRVGMRGDPSCGVG